MATVVPEDGTNAEVGPHQQQPNRKIAKNKSQKDSPFNVLLVVAILIIGIAILGK